MLTFLLVISALLLVTKATQNYHDLWIPRQDIIFSEFDTNSDVVRTRQFTVINEQPTNVSELSSPRFPRLPEMTKKLMKLGKDEGYMVHLFTDFQVYTSIYRDPQRVINNGSLIQARLFLMPLDELEQLKSQLNQTEDSEDIPNIMNRLMIDGELECNGDRANQSGFRLLRHRLYFYMCKDTGIKSFRSSSRTRRREEELGIVIWAPSLDVPFITSWCIKSTFLRPKYFQFLRVPNGWTLEFPPVSDIQHAVYRHLTVLRLQSNMSIKFALPPLDVEDQMISITKNANENGDTDDDDECPVCLNHINQEDDLVRPVKCQHKYHRKCLKRWLETKPISAGPCPSCRWGSSDQ